MSRSLEPRIATDADFEPIGTLIARAFLSDTETVDFERHRPLFEPERAHVIDDAGVPVATGAVRTRDLTVPGAVVPAAHVTGVAVASTHRRRGLLSSIMTTQLNAVREQGSEPIAVLWASEGAIYGRYGYGLASWAVGYDVDVRETAVPGGLPASARLRQAVPKEAVAELAGVLDRIRPDAPGLSSRSTKKWEFMTADAPSGRHGMSAENAVLYEHDGRVDGYARYRTQGGWGSNGPTGTVQVTEVVSATPEAHAALWRYLLSIDLARKVTYRFGAVDDPLPHMVTNPDGLGASLSPALWVRIVDVPGALAARRYAVPVDAVIEVSDERLTGNAGRWRLVGDTESASCQASDAEPDLSLDVAELGSVYLGGVSLTTLAATGLVTEHTTGAVPTVSAAFGWRRAPSALEIF